MPVWGLKYQTQFTSNTDENNGEYTYTLQFLFKDYSGGVNSLVGSSTTVVQKCTVDDPMAPIKGQSLEIGLLNTGLIPIIAFYSEDDDGVQVKLLDQNNNILFIGFLVQDDIVEPLVDYPHEISLSASDSLGLLKGVLLSEAVVKRAYVVNARTNGPLNEILLSVSDTSFYANVGDTLTLFGADYIINAISTVEIILLGHLYNYTFTVTPDSPAIIPQQSTTIYITGRINLLERNSLLTIIGTCLYSTNLSLLLNIYCNIKEINQDSALSFFEQTIVDTSTFMQGDIFENCYKVLELILDTFRCTLFQCNGQWQILRFSELQLYPTYQIPGFQYDEGLDLIGTTLFDNIFNIGPSPQLTRPIVGITETITRPLKFVRREFKYRQPKYVLRNYDLNRVGILLREYLSGGLTYKEYIALDWEVGYGTPPMERFIRVIYDGDGFEVERYLVLKGIPFDDPKAIQGTPFEAQQFDRLEYSFSWRTTLLPYIIAQFGLMVTDNVNYKYARNFPVGAGEWGLPYFAYTSLGFNNTWEHVSIGTSGIPYDGLVYPYLAQLNNYPTVTSETHYTNIRMEYKAYINSSTRIIAQSHTDTQSKVVKNNSDNVVFLDDIPTIQLAGGLFLTTKHNLIQDKTKLWGYNANGVYIKRLGNLMVSEELSYRLKPRSKIEGSFVGVIQNNMVSLLTAITTDYKPSKVYTFGLLKIDYKRNSFSAVLWEISEIGGEQLASDYVFKYIVQ